MIFKMDNRQIITTQQNQLKEFPREKQTNIPFALKMWGSGLW